MKFGATLSRRSVPQWRTHDLDYDEIKNLIKIQTSSTEGCSRQFETNLLSVLDSELKRIDEFVRCKAGEIERRLAACQRTVKTATRDTSNEGGNNKTTLKRFFKIEAEIDRVSKDAQLLARFVNAQYMGFQKILKKHAKWCHLSPNTPSSLSSQFIPHLETQHPFHRRVNYQHILRQLSSLYNARQDPENPENAVSSTTDDENLDESSLQSSVTYWVHSDNQVETELFLLKHLTLQVPTFPVSSGAIQRSTRAAYLDSYKWEGYENSVPVRNVSSNGRGRVPYIVWEENSRNKDVLMVVPEENISLPMKRKNVNKFLSSTEEVDLSLPEWTFSMDGGRWTKSAQKVHEYIHTSSLHPVSAERTSFIKTSRNSSTPLPARIHATMDRNILSTRLPRTSTLNFDNDEEYINLEGHKNVFSHAVLTIRWEGDSPRWLEELNGSHLIERVNGFSMYTHAVSVLIPSEVHKLPYWLPLLQNDIRKLQPALPRTVRRRDSASPFVTTDSKTNSSSEQLRNPSYETIPTAVSPGVERMIRKKNKSGRNGYGSVPPSSIVYWSEFETPEEEPFTVPIDENASLLSWFRSSKQPHDIESQRHGEDKPFLSRAMQKLYGVVETSADGLTTLFYEKIGREGDIPQTTDDESYASESSSVSPNIPTHDIDRISRSQLLNRGYCLCVIGCTILLSVFGILGFLFNAVPAGIAFVLVGFLLAVTLEIVSLVRFIMQGGHHGVAWIGFMVVVVAGAAFIAFVALTEEA